MRATLENILTARNFEKMMPLAVRFNDGVAAEIKKHGPTVERAAARRPRRVHLLPAGSANGGESAAAVDFEMERFLHLYALNRGVLLTPFHNMALMCPETTAADIDRHTRLFAEAVNELASM